MGTLGGLRQLSLTGMSCKVSRRLITTMLIHRCYSRWKPYPCRPVKSLRDVDKANMAVVKLLVASHHVVAVRKRIATAYSEHRIVEEVV